MKKFVGTLAAVTAVALLTLGSASAASASPDGTEPGLDTTPDRIINVDQPAPKPQHMVFLEGGDHRAASQEYDVYLAQDDEFPLIPEPGETVRILYTDAVTDIATEASTARSAAAACTTSITVGTPYEVSERPRGSGSAMRSSGCSGSTSTFFLSVYDSTYERANGSISVPNNGSSWGVNVVGNTCWGSTSTTYWGHGRLGALGGTRGPTTKLTCSY